ncbi:MAG TPA: GNAT family N-acetyltransferase [Pseudomonadales bacterium]
MFEVPKMKVAESDEEIAACFDVMKELRENLNREEFLSTIRIMKEEGYILSYLEFDGEVTSVAGFRICFNLAAEGRALYIYDLVTSQWHRSKGYGARLLDAVRDYASQRGCTVIHLDSGVFRYKAHKFYLTHGFEIRAHHFLQRLDGK